MDMRWNKWREEVGIEENIRCLAAGEIEKDL